MKRIWCCLGSLMLCCSLLNSCAEKRGTSVHIIVPDGFKGLIKILKDKTGEKIELEGSEYVYRIPTNGILKVKEAIGFDKWHYTEASYLSGRPLLVHPQAGKGNVFLFELGSSSSGKKFLFVGTEEEKMDAMKDSFNLLR